MGLNSTPVAQTQVYAQNTSPVDERDGVLWVDTSVSPRETFVYSETSASWEPIAPSEFSAIPWEFDGTWSASGSSASTYTLSASDYDQIRFLAIDLANANGDRMRWNGDTGTNYDIVTFGNTETSNASYIELQNMSMVSSFTVDAASFGALRANFDPGRQLSVQTRAAQNPQLSGLNSIEIYDSGGGTLDFTFLVFGVRQ